MMARPKPSRSWRATMIPIFLYPATGRHHASSPSAGFLPVSAGYPLISLSRRCRRWTSLTINVSGLLTGALTADHGHPGRHAADQAVRDDPRHQRNLLDKLAWAFPASGLSSTSTAASTLPPGDKQAAISTAQKRKRRLNNLDYPAGSWPGRPIRADSPVMLIAVQSIHRGNAASSTDIAENIIVSSISTWAGVAEVTVNEVRRLLRGAGRRRPLTSFSIAASAGVDTVNTAVANANNQVPGSAPARRSSEHDERSMRIR